MTEEQKVVKPKNSVSFTDMSTLKCKKLDPVPTEKSEVVNDTSEDDIAVLEQHLDTRQTHLLVPLPDRDITPPTIFRLREPRQGPSLRPRGSKRSTMTWPGCR